MLNLHYIKLNKIKKFLMILFLLFFSINFNSTTNADIEIKKISYDKFNQLSALINNEFFDPRRNKLTKIFKLMYFALSKDGKFSSVSICDTNALYDYDCIDFSERFKTQKNCEKISKQKCSIIISKNKILLNGKTYYLNDKNTQEILKIFSNEKIQILKNNSVVKNSSIIIFTGLQSRDLDN